MSNYEIITFTSIHSILDFLRVLVWGAVLRGRSKEDASVEKTEICIYYYAPCPLKILVLQKLSYSKSRRSNFVFFIFHLDYLILKAVFISTSSILHSTNAKGSYIDLCKMFLWSQGCTPTENTNENLTYYICILWKHS